MAYEVCFSFAIAYSQTARQAIEISIVNYLWPSLTVLAFVIFKELKFNFLIILGLLISISGIIFIQTGSGDFSLNSLVDNFHSNPLSYILAFTGAIIWAFYCVITKNEQWAKPHFHFLCWCRAYSLAQAACLGAIRHSINGYSSSHHPFSGICCHGFWLCCLEHWHHSWKHYHTCGGFLFHPDYLVYFGHVCFTNSIIDELLARNSNGDGWFLYLLGFNELVCDSALL